jgi:hypothetical protein
MRCADYSAFCIWSLIFHARDVVLVIWATYDKERDIVCVIQAILINFTHTIRAQGRCEIFTPTLHCIISESWCQPAQPARDCDYVRHSVDANTRTRHVQPTHRARIQLSVMASQFLRPGLTTQETHTNQIEVLKFLCYHIWGNPTFCSSPIFNPYDLR